MFSSKSAGSLVERRSKQAYFARLAARCRWLTGSCCVSSKTLRLPFFFCINNISLFYAASYSSSNSCSVLFFLRSFSVPSFCPSFALDQRCLVLPNGVPPLALSTRRIGYLLRSASPRREHPFSNFLLSNVLVPVLFHRQDLSLSCGFLLPRSLGTLSTVQLGFSTVCHVSAPGYGLLRILILRVLIGGVNPKVFPSHRFFKNGVVDKEKLFQSPRPQVSYQMLDKPTSELCLKNDRRRAGSRALERTFDGSRL